VAPHVHLHPQGIANISGVGVDPLSI
jgi:hypothetical protein